MPPEESKSGPEQRREQRNYAVLIVNVKALDDDTYNVDAITADANSTSVTLITHKSVNAGTQIEIRIGGELAATGEVVNLYPGENGLTRMGVRLIEKNENWQLLL
jgi:hypothetical protein